MFEASCSQPIDDTGATCGIFGPLKASGVDLTNVSIEDFLLKLDLSEYKDTFTKAGITTVGALSRLTEADLEAFGLRKLEKRKLLHHLNKVRGADIDNNMLCGTG